MPKTPLIPDDILQPTLSTPLIQRAGRSPDSKWTHLKSNELLDPELDPAFDMLRAKITNQGDEPYRQRQWMPSDILWPPSNWRKFVAVLNDEGTAKYLFLGASLGPLAVLILLSLRFFFAFMGALFQPLAPAASVFTALPLWAYPILLILTIPPALFWAARRSFYSVFDHVFIVEPAQERFTETYIATEFLQDRSNSLDGDTHVMLIEEEGCGLDCGREPCDHPPRNLYDDDLVDATPTAYPAGIDQMRANYVQIDNRRIYGRFLAPKKREQRNELLRLQPYMIPHYIAWAYTAAMFLLIQDPTPP